MQHLGDVLEGEATLVVLERANKDDAGRKQQERRRVGEERDDAEPGERKATPAGPR